MNHKLLTVIVSYNRPELLRRTIDSYVETVSLPHKLIVVDNASDPDTRKLLRQLPRGIATVALLDRNYYPGYATNFGWRFAIDRKKAPYTLLHRSDNDVEYLPGWADHVAERFAADQTLGQLGLRTTAEEGNVGNVGGNCVIRRQVWDAGARYGEEPWNVVPFEDAHMTHAVHAAGFGWSRADVPCVVHIGAASRHDPYYQHTFQTRGIDFASYGL